MSPARTEIACLESVMKEHGYAYAFGYADSVIRTAQILVANGFPRKALETLSAALGEPVPVMREPIDAIVRSVA